MIERKAVAYLSKWRLKKHRKPLVLQGARQVGKTSFVKVFSKQFMHFIHLNLELLEEKKLFEQGNDVKVFMQRALLRNNIKEDLNNTLLFIDEIQESPEAIAMLRYFL